MYYPKITLPYKRRNSIGVDLLTAFSLNLFFRKLGKSKAFEKNTIGSNDGSIFNFPVQNLIANSF